VKFLRKKRVSSWVLFITGPEDFGIDIVRDVAAQILPRDLEVFQECAGQQLQPHPPSNLSQDGLLKLSMAMVSATAFMNI
jgi:hypothetical protein